jgi:hypothetical protein
MSQLSKAAYETKYNDSSTGLYKAGQTQGIGSDDHRTQVTDHKDSLLWWLDHVKDEDNMASDSASHVPTQQSVKAYVDSHVPAALAWKNPCKAATTANITLSGTQTIDGISIIAGDRVLVKDQTTASANGIYVCAAGAWSRATDADSAAELEGAAVIVQQGTSNADTTWVQTTDGITLGSSNIVWAAMTTSVPDATETVKGKVELATTAEVITGTDTVRAVTPAGVRAATWYLTGTNTLGGANVVVGTATNTLKFQFDSLGTTQTNGAGLWMANTTAAAAGAQQISPSLVLEGQGWRTNATAESQSVKWAIYVVPVQGAANPSAQLLFRQSINAGAYATYFSLDPTSGNNISGNESTTIQSNVSSTALTLNAQGSSTGVLNLASSGVSRNRFLWSTSYALQIETPGVGIGGAPATKVAFQVTPLAHTALTASTEQSDFIISGDRTVQWSTGSLTTQRFTWFKGATLSFVGASTVTNAYNVYIDDLTAGTNATITNKYSLGLAGNLYVGGSITNGSGVLYVGTSTESGTSRSVIARGSGSDIDLNIVAKGTGVVIIDNMEVRASDYTGDKINLRDTSVSSRAYTRHFGSGNVSVTADYNSSQGCYDTSSLPNNTVIVLYVTFVVIKSDGSEAGSILMKTTWRKNNSGTLTKLSDKIIDSDEDAAGTLTLTSTNSGAVIQTNIVSSGGSGSFRYGIYIDRVIHSY